MLNHFPKPTFEDIPLLDLALSDVKSTVRRQAIVLLGMIESNKFYRIYIRGFVISCCKEEQQGIA